MSPPTVICLTPVKNEAWIFESFLQCANLWADHIIIADQNSDDDSRKIASRFEKVIIIQNTATSYDEQQRQKLLLEAARKLPFPRLLITLDVDEFLTPNFNSSTEWHEILASQPGTVIKMPTVQIKPNFKQYWQTGKAPLGYMDDGYKHSGDLIHSPRIPLPDNSLEIVLKDVLVMHFQYVDWERMRRKHCWYQCWERLNRPDRSAIDIFRQYHHVFGIGKNELKEIPDWWFAGYAGYGIDIRNIRRDKLYRWDREILKIMETNGTKLFKKEAIWDYQWQEIACQYGYKNTKQFQDPRSPFEKVVHSWLLMTQPYADTIAIKLVGKILKKMLGW